jgi:hypothetical protein
MRCFVHSVMPVHHEFVADQMHEQSIAKLVNGGWLWASFVDFRKLTMATTLLYDLITCSTLRALQGLEETADTLATLTDLSTLIRRPSGRGELNNPTREAQDKVITDNATKLINKCLPGSQTVWNWFAQALQTSWLSYASIPIKCLPMPIDATRESKHTCSYLAMLDLYVVGTC